MTLSLEELAKQLGDLKEKVDRECGKRVEVGDELRKELEAISQLAANGERRVYEGTLDSKLNAKLKKLAYPALFLLGIFTLITYFGFDFYIDEQVDNALQDKSLASFESLQEQAENIVKDMEEIKRGHEKLLSDK